jgi:hypothetical protein
VANQFLQIAATGEAKIQVFDKKGFLKDQRISKNLIVTEGLVYICGRMVEASRPNEMTHMGIGTGTTAASASQVALVSQNGARVALTGSDGTPSSNTVVYAASFAGSHSGAITEAGIFNAASGTDVMLCRTVFSVVNKATDDTMTITWTITLNAS